MRITDVTLTAFSYSDPEPGLWNGIIGYPPRTRRKGFSRLTVTTDDGAVGMPGSVGQHEAMGAQMPLARSVDNHLSMTHTGTHAHVDMKAVNHRERRISRASRVINIRHARNTLLIA